MQFQMNALIAANAIMKEGSYLGGNANQNKVWLEEELINFHNQFYLYLSILILKPVWQCMSVAVVASRHGRALQA